MFYAILTGYLKGILWFIVIAGLAWAATGEHAWFFWGGLVWALADWLDGKIAKANRSRRLG